MNFFIWYLVFRIDDVIKFIVEKELKGEVLFFGVVIDVMINVEILIVMMGYGLEGLIYSILCG